MQQTLREQSAKDLIPSRKRATTTERTNTHTEHRRGRSHTALSLSLVNLPLSYDGVVHRSNRSPSSWPLRTTPGSPCCCTNPPFVKLDQESCFCCNKACLESNASWSSSAEPKSTLLAEMIPYCFLRKKVIGKNIPYSNNLWCQK